MDLKRLVHKVRYVRKCQHKLSDKKNEKQRIEIVYNKQPNKSIV